MVIGYWLLVNRHSPSTSKIPINDPQPLSLGYEFHFKSHPLPLPKAPKAPKGCLWQGISWFTGRDKIMNVICDAANPWWS